MDFTSLMLIELDTILIPVKNMAVSKDFYELIFGQCSFRSEHWTSFSVSGIKIGLHLDSNDTIAIPGISPCFRVLDLEIFKAKLVEKKYRFSPEYHVTPRGCILDFYDPDGHHLQAIQLK